jgi:hypothetical protein
VVKQTITAMDMVQKPITKMILPLPLALAGILILAVLTAIPSNNRTFASPSSSEESTDAGTAQESNNEQTCPDGSTPDASGNCPTLPPPAGERETTEE